MSVNFALLSQIEDVLKEEVGSSTIKCVFPNFQKVRLISGLAMPYFCDVSRHFSIFFLNERIFLYML